MPGNPAVDLLFGLLVETIGRCGAQQAVDLFEVRDDGVGRMEIRIVLVRAQRTPVAGEEGGPEAQLYIKAGGHEFEFIGSFESNFNNNNDNNFAWPIPNVVGITLRKPSTEQ